MKKLMNEIRELNVVMKIAISMLMGGAFSAPIQYLRGVYGLDKMIIKIMVCIILIFSVIKFFPGVERQKSLENEDKI